MNPYLAMVVLVAGGCASASMPNAVGADSGDDQGRDAPHGDAHPGSDAAPRIDAPLPPDAPQPRSDTVLLSEIQLGPTGAEFVEIVNPTAAAIDLSTYYVSDRADYYKLPLGTGSANLPGSTSDFIAQFPAGTSIPARGVLTIAVGSVASFASTTGATADFGVKDTTSKAMRQTLVGSTPSLTDSGEPIVLFQWDGTSMLVKDVDIMLAGAPTGANVFTSKSQVMQGGSAYAVDANTLPTQTAPAPGMSTKRILLETTHENQNGNGNGILGDDETSENTLVTWDSANYSPATPGSVPAALLP